MIWVGNYLKKHLFPAPPLDQVALPLDQIAQGFIQLDLEHFLPNI